MDECAIGRTAPPPFASLRLFRPEADAVTAAEAALGFTLHRQAGAWSPDEISTLRIQPGEWLVRGMGECEIGARLCGTLHHAADLSGGCAAWSVTGRAAATLLAMGGTLDFAAWRPGAGARTIVAKVPMIVSRLDDGFELLAEISLAAYLDAWLSAAVGRHAPTGPAPSEAVAQTN